eukprot:802206-Amphidinium_carterae.1
MIKAGKVESTNGQTAYDVIVPMLGWAGYATGRGKSQTRSGTTLLPVVDADSEKVHKFTSDNAKQIQAEVLK